MKTYKNKKGETIHVTDGGWKISQCRIDENKKKAVIDSMNRQIEFAERCKEKIQKAYESGNKEDLEYHLFMWSRLLDAETLKKYQGGERSAC